MSADVAVAAVSEPYAGFAGAPRVLGFDEEGREVLTYVPGDVPGENRLAGPGLAEDELASHVVADQPGLGRGGGEVDDAVAAGGRLARVDTTVSPHNDVVDPGLKQILLARKVIGQRRIGDIGARGDGAMRNRVRPVQNDDSRYVARGAPVLVSHEANIHLDHTEGRPGLLYVRKQPYADADTTELGDRRSLAHRSIIVDEFFFYQLGLLLRRRAIVEDTGTVLSVLGEREAAERLHLGS